MPMGKKTINNITKTVKENSPVKDVCPDKELTNHSARKTVVKKLKSSGVPKCEVKKHHWPQIRARITRLWFRWWKRAKNYVQQWQCNKCKTSTPTSHISTNTSQSSLQFQPLQCVEAILPNQVSVRASEVPRGSFCQILTLIKLNFNAWNCLTLPKKGLTPIFVDSEDLPNWTF